MEAIVLKRICIVLLSIVWLGTIIVPQVHADKVQVNTNNLNVRKAPSIDSEIIDQVQTGELYQILQIQQNWVQIQISDKAGWVSSNYVTIKQEIKKEQTSIIDEKREITTSNDNIHLRSGPSSEHPIISYIETGTELTITKENDHWYRVNHNGEIGYVFYKIIDRNQKNSSLYDKSILIDAGHGGLDVGAIGSHGTYEKEMTFQTANNLQQKLMALGANVILTRKNDDYIRLGSRTALSNISNADVFISIHYNSFPEIPTVSGIGTYYYQEKNKKLAQFVQEELINETNAHDRQTAYEDYQVLRQNNKPAILVELGFISNEQEEQQLVTNTYQDKLTNGIVQGLSTYFLTSN